MSVVESASLAGFRLEWLDSAFKKDLIADFMRCAVVVRQMNFSRLDLRSSLVRLRVIRAECHAASVLDFPSAAGVLCLSPHLS